MKGLKVVLWICGVSCLLGFIFAVLPWRTITTLFEWFGIQPLEARPIIVYMIRMFSVIVGMIGIFFVFLALNPLNYGAMLLLAAYGLLCYGVLSLVGGIRYGFPIWIFAGDVIFGVAFGILILVFRKKTMQESAT